MRVSAIRILTPLFALPVAALADTGQLTESAYASQSSTMGVVLFDADLGRYANCGGYETVQLRRIAFNRMPLANLQPDAAADAEITGPTIPTAAPRGFRNFAFLLPPGQYAMTRMSIRVTRSMTQVGSLEAGPDKLAPGGTPSAGLFRVEAGEIVYIGNFKIDCDPPMTLWRYFTEGRENFAKQLAEYKQSFPFLKLENVKYRLFETSTIGRPYELP